jgi:hypothetical protein
MVPTSNDFPLLYDFNKSNGGYQQRKAIELCIAADDLADVTENTIDRAARYLDEIQYRHNNNIQPIAEALLAEVVELSERLTDTAG